jgi:hypothetical protein
MFHFMSCILYSVMCSRQMFEFVTVNIFVIAIYFLTRTIYSISKVVEIVNCRTVVHRTVMTLWTWVKSMIQVDMSFGHRRKRQQHRNKKHHGPRYYIRHIKRNSSRVRWRRSHNRLCIIYTFASLPKTTNKDKYLHKDAHQIHFDSDSFIIGIDNHASRSISNNIDHFTTALRSPKNAFIQGVGGELLTVKGEGTLVWHVEDDEGRAHRITIKDSLFRAESTNMPVITTTWESVCRRHSSETAWHMVCGLS